MQRQEGSLSLHPAPSPPNSPCLFQRHQCSLTLRTLCSDWCPLSSLGTPSAGHRKCFKREEKYFISFCHCISQHLWVHVGRTHRAQELSTLPGQGMPVPGGCWYPRDALKASRHFSPGKTLLLEFWRQESQAWRVPGGHRAMLNTHAVSPRG